MEYMMPYRIESTYCWYSDWQNKDKRIVYMYYINGVPFTYDELEDIDEDSVYMPGIVMIANNETKYNTEDLFNHYSYLMEEECHPLAFELELENPEKLPVD